ncbi:MAG TPA: extracellular solute-binding protein, partial [Gaiellaceae bacterium]|nr:extracellular solute-binding protein [Gaiellaceae bacterium]
MKSIRIATAVAVAGLLAVGATAAAVGSTTKSVTISVASLIPGSTPAAVQQFNAQVAEFQKANPSIKVKSVEYQWTGPTFAAKLAAGTLPTVFTVPFTDARTLGDNGQLADLTAGVKALPYYSKFNPAVLAEGTDAKKQIVALPTAAYAQALHYNRKLFAQAGLDPNKPPTTWAQLQSDALKIAQKTGKAGYVQMAKDDNTAGWILTTLVYALGGRMEKGAGSHAVATLNNPQTVAALNLLKHMRWTDNSMGSNFDYGWSDINQAFAAGTVGMYISGSDVYTNLVQASNIDPSIYGLAALPLAKNKNAGVLGGGTLVAVKPKANSAEKAAALKWIDFYYEEPLITKSQAIRNARTLVANKQPVGVPALPVFNKTQYDLANTWIKPYINVPIAQMKPFTTGIFNQQLIPEPAV